MQTFFKAFETVAKSLFEDLKIAVKKMQTNIQAKGKKIHDKAEAKIIEIGKAFEKCLK